MYTLIISNATIEVLSNQNNDIKKKNLLKSTKTTNKSYSKKSTSKVSVKTQKSHMSYVTNRKLKGNPYTIENQIDFAKYVYKTTKYTIDDIGKTTNWDPIKVANYNIIHIKGYTTFSKKNPEVAEVIDSLIGLDKNGDMKIKDVILNLLPFVPGGVILTGITRVGKGVNILRRLTLVSRLNRYNNFIYPSLNFILDYLPKVASFASKPIGTISSISFEKITPKIYNRLGLIYSDSVTSRILNNHYRDFESVTSISNWKSYVVNQTNKKVSKAKKLKKNSKNLKNNTLKNIKLKLKDSISTGLNFVVGLFSKSWNKSVKNPSLKNKYRNKYRKKIYSSFNNSSSKIVSGIKRKYKKFNYKLKRKFRIKRRVKAKNFVKKIFKSYAKRSFRKIFSRNNGRRKIRTNFRKRYTSRTRMKFGNIFKKLKFW